jgi:nucleoside-diphosphate-sugar epimerase
MSSEDYEQRASRLQGERVMLVGGAGFIGHNLALELTRLGVETIVLDNLVVNNLVTNVETPDLDDHRRELYQNFLLDRFRLMRESGVHLRNVDARLLIDLTRSFDEFEPTKVVHMSAIASAVDAATDPGLAFDLQLVTLRNVLELCRAQADRGIQIVFMSSSTVYGDFETSSVNEATRPRPRGIYANAKYMGERLVRDYSRYGLSHSIVRPSALYGERCVSRRVSQVFIENALTGKPLLLEGGGDGRLDFTYIEDLVRGIVLAMAVPEPLPGRDTFTRTFNLTFGHARTIAELAAVLREVIPDVIVEERPRVQEKPIRGTLETDLACDYLGFKPKWPLEIGYRKYCEWYVDEWHRVGRME